MCGPSTAVVAAGDAEGVLQARAHPSTAPRLGGQAIGPARTPAQRRRITDAPAITRATESSTRVRIAAIVHEKTIGDRGKPAGGVAIGERDGLVGHVAGRHHQRPRRTLEQQHVERRVRDAISPERRRPEPPPAATGASRAGS